MSDHVDIRSRHTFARCICCAVFAMSCLAPIHICAMPAEDQSAEDNEPSLDELLGLEDSEESASAAETAREDHEQELEQHLSDAQISDAFKQAIAKMTISARLLEENFDPGIGTQRVQEDILAKLDMLVREAKRRSQQPSQSSSSSSNQSDQSPGKRQQSQQHSGQQQPAGKQAAESDPNRQELPDRQGADSNTVLEEGRTEWGNLPERLRDMLLQGRSNNARSALYRSLTDEYYRRLAEDRLP